MASTARASIVAKAGEDKRKNTDKPKQQACSLTASQRNANAVGKSNL
jgi:hypothetical protein